MKHKNFFRMLFFFFCILLIQDKYVLSEEQLKIIHGPYLNDPAEDAMTIVWFTNKECLSWVEYCGDKSFGTFPTWGGYPQIAKSIHNGLVDANTKKHTIRIFNLKPGTKYRYRIASKEILRFNPYEVVYGESVVSEVSEFETLNPTKTTFSFGVVTDVHEQGANLDTLLQITDLDSLDLMFYTGDMLNWIGNENRIFKGFLDVSVNHFAKEKPFILVRGNHETRGPLARNLMQYFPHSSGRFYYSFNHGNVYFIIMDSGEDKPDSHPVYAGLADFDRYRDEQAEWLLITTQSAAFKQSLYKIVLVHIPLFSGSKGHGAKDITKKWGPILNNAKVDLLISGHHHRYSEIKKTEGRNSFPVLVIGKDMIMKTDVSEKHLLLTIKNIDGKIVDTVIIPAQSK